MDLPPLAPDAVAGAVRAARDGDLAAFNALVRTFQRQVYALCYRLLGNAEDAADAAQEAFLSAYRGLGGFRGEGDGFAAWLMRIASNASYDSLRRRQRRPTVSMDAPAEENGHDGGTGLSIPDTEPGPERRALSAETARRIQAGLDSLVYEQRLTVVLCDVQGHSYEEAASIMGVEVGTVKSRLSRARAALRVYLLAQGELPSAAQRLEG